MGNKRRIIVVVLLVVVFGGFALVVLRPHEPVYQGRSLTAWLNDYKDAQLDGSDTSKAKAKNATHAIREIGNNALPTLIKLIESNHSPLMMRLVELTSKQSLIRFPSIQDRERQDRARQYNASCGFLILGAAAKSAVPKLSELLWTDESGYVAISLARIAPDGVEILAQVLTNKALNLTPKSIEVRRKAVLALEVMGTDQERRASLELNIAISFPALLETLKDNDKSLREGAANALGTFARQPEKVVPALAVRLQDTSWLVAASAAYALGKFKGEAKIAVPALLNAFGSQNPRVRESVVKALKQIDPEAAMVPELAERLHDTSWEYASAAADALGKLKGNAKLAVPALLNALEHPDARVRESAAKALKEIDPEAAAKAGVK